MMDAKQDPFAPIVFLLLCYIVLVCVGCSVLWGSQSSVIVSGSSNVHEERYLFGIKTYLSQDYRSAAEIFSPIARDDTNPLLARKALYGLACARLMLADSEDALQMALNDWRKWVALAPQEWTVENPLLMDPMVSGKMMMAGLRRSITQNHAGEYVQLPSTSECFELLEEMAGMTSRLKTAEQQVAQQQNTIQALNRENARLKEQIRAIELIDQKIQEKKTAIPPAD